MKRSPLKRGGSLLRRTPMPQPTQPIRHRSVRTERLYRTQRRPLVARLLAERPVCERCREARSVDVHELVRRSQSTAAVTDESIMRAVCRTCHDWIGLNPTAAVDEGFAMWGWQYREGAS